MSDSPKFSLLDLQSLDLSQYAKRNLEQRRSGTRGTESSYRKQLSESLAKKQTSTAPETTRGAESRSAELRTSNSRTESKRLESRSASEARDARNPLENERREPAQTDTKVAPEESTVPVSGSEKTAGESEQTISDQSDQLEATEELVNPQVVVSQPVKEKEQAYSLFNTSFAVQNADAFDAEVTTADSEIQAPAHFQFGGDQSLVNLQTDVTEVGLNDAIAIPEGLAEQLGKQLVETSETETQPVASFEDVAQLIQNLTSGDQQAETEGDQGINETSTSSIEGTLDTEALSQLELTEELKQAIEEFQSSQSDANQGTENNEIDIQALIQQRYRQSQQEESSEADSEQTVQGELPLDQNSLQQISETVIEQLQQPAETEQADIREIVSETSAREARLAGDPEQVGDELAQNGINQGVKPAAELLSQTPVEAAKPAAVTQETTTADVDQTLVQSSSATTTQTTGTQSTAAVGPTVDAKQVEQLVERVVEAVRQSQSTGQQLKIRLSPPELGTLQIEVSLKNGEYTAKLEVQNSSAQKVINDNIAQLKEALSKTGVSLDRIDVHINTDATEDQRSSYSDAQSQSGSDFESNQFSEHAGDSDEWQQESGYTEEAVRQDDSEEQERPQVMRSQGVARDNVEEIDVQI